MVGTLNSGALRGFGFFFGGTQYVDLYMYINICTDALRPLQAI